jgi:hypothetical protein
MDTSKGNSHPQKNTLLKNAQANAESIFFKRVFFSPPREEFYFFSPTLRCFNFFATAQQPTTDKHLDRTTQVTNRLELDADEEARTGNSGFKKLAVQWLQEVQFSNGTFVVADSLVLRNRQLLKPANR